MTDEKILRIKETLFPLKEISRLVHRLHAEGPISSDLLEDISLYKEFHPEQFAEAEEAVISAMGLFYKINEPEDVYSLIMATVGHFHKEMFGSALTPVQANVRAALDNNQYISISAPTSAGKSYSIRDFIAKQSGDAVVVVPSRALIAEYIASLRREFDGVKEVMVSPFVDDVFKKRNLRHVFVLTPERARELFLAEHHLDISVFFFDEAQMSEEKGRGVIFDVLVRRVKKRFPSAKIIFAHPFVDNPSAQLKKHNIDERKSFSRSYTHGAVGKISIYRHDNDKDYYFSPFVEKGHHIKKCLEFNGGFKKFAFNGHHSILIFVSKASIYSGKFIEPFQEYIDAFSEVTDPVAREIVDAVEHALGADQNEHRSKLVSLLRKGVVIHHGSVPLEVRFLVEDFIRQKFARVCFATNTLAQGVNMPFDIVWLHSMKVMGEDDKDRSLSFKNLTGRAGRLSSEKKFDYGYVFTSNPTLYTKRITDSFALSEQSIIDMDYAGESDEVKELISSIREETFDDEHNMPKTRVTRLSQPAVFAACERILDLLYLEDSIRLSVEGEKNRAARDVVRASFKEIFEESIGRKLHYGEEAVFGTAIMIFLWAIAGRTFREIAGIRHSNISRRDFGYQGEAEFSQPAESLPNGKLQHRYSLFAGVAAKDVSYDSVVFDTYDYIDKVISFSLSDAFMAAFKIYGESRNDARALKMIELLRFGTNNVDHILLMRYGFPPEAVVEIMPYIQFVTESEIVFSKEIESAPQSIRDMAEWYLP
jgi:hypothetical protein